MDSLALVTYQIYIDSFEYRNANQRRYIYPAESATMVGDRELPVCRMNM
jgi:hypothetical protein